PSNSSDTTTSSDSSGAAAGNIDNLSFEQQVAALVNEQREANGLAPLTLSSELSNVARAKSQDMHDNNYFSHTSPTYGSPFDMLKAFGISYRAAGENIAMGYATPEAVVNGWMNSAGHRANILNSAYTQIGVGYVADGNYWTQEFIG
ncbi:MAG: CAP domain-containing protein, partial [Oscillospiraceae bacterium]